jgi:cytochrome c-type biogenesis protein CcmH
MRVLAAALTTAAVALAPTIGTTAAASTSAATPRASLTDIENDVMCVSCREPLALAQSPQADSERAYIRTLIAQGKTKSQIEAMLVAQYGPSVLGKPPAHGFNLTVYILPPALLVAGALLLAVALPRWRARARARARAQEQASAAGPMPAAPRLDPADARRLQEDLARFD